ncbi:MAG: zinc ABC transporter substrate-binding protein [Spirochaetales bacterium]|nr:zinc ABC transporter substrate-binding protein [Spirochaetales bacterium]
MNRVIPIIIISIIIATALGTGVYFLFFHNKGAGTSVSTPEPTYLPEEDIHHVPLKDNPMFIVVSTDLIREILYQFARARSDKPYVCIKPGVNPLLYKPTEDDKEKMLQADLVLYMGLGLEPGIETLVKQVSSKVRCEAISSVLLEKENKDQLIPSRDYKGGYDPHFWWNPMLWEKVILHVVHILSDVDPEFEFSYGSTFIRYGESLHMMDLRYIQPWSGRLSEQRRVLITLHPAFTYFGKKFGYEVMSLYTPDSPDTVSEKRRESIADFIIKNKIPALFPEYGFPATEMEALQAGIKNRGYEVKIAKPLYSYCLDEAGSKNYLYLNAGRTQMDRIYYALKYPEDPGMPGH